MREDTSPSVVLADRCDIAMEALVEWLQQQVDRGADPLALGFACVGMGSDLVQREAGLDGALSALTVAANTLKSTDLKG